MLELEELCEELAEVQGGAMRCEVCNLPIDYEDFCRFKSFRRGGREEDTGEVSLVLGYQSV